MSSLNFMELCRLCLVKDRVQIPIFEGEGDIRQIFLKIAACLPIKVKKDDKLPKKICDDCMYKVEMLYQFWNTTANAEKQLLEWLGEAVEEKKTDTHVKAESIEQDSGSELAKSLSRVEAVLAEAREQESDNDNFAGESKPETDSDDEPLSSLEPTTFVNVGLNGSGTSGSRTQGEFLAPNAPSTSKTSTSSSAQVAASGSSEERSRKRRTKEKKTSNIIELNEQSEFYCAFCESSFENSKELEEHCDVHHVECDLCNKVFKRKFHLRNHMRETHSDIEGKVACDYCNKLFVTHMSRWLHTKNVHKNNWKYKCEHCEYGTTHLTLFKNHLAKHTEPSTLKCNICDISFKSKSRYEIHNKIHEKSLKCAICNKSFSKRKNMLRHINRNHGEKKERDVPCEKCHKMFYDKWTLRVHMEVHNNVKEHCPHCSYTTCHPKNMKAHVKNHVQAFDFVCETCGRGFVYNFMLRDHILKEHGEGLPRIPCDICNKTFATQQYLNIHKQSHEDGYLHRNHQCEICGKKFLTRSMLLRHLRGHKRVYRYECQFCNKILSCLATLKDHEKIHTGEKPFICEVCGKCFGAKQYLVTHARTHTNVRPFTCQECGQSFSQRGTLSMHQRSHHKRNKIDNNQPIALLE